VAIIGPSGSGKTTLLHLMGLIDLPTKGHLEISGQNCNQLSESERAIFRNQKIGFIFQDFHLFDHLTVAENIQLPLLIKGQASPEKINQLAEQLHIERVINNLPTQISGGQKQRVAIARALINQPEILLADEPTGNLDSDTGNKIIKLLKDINKEQGLTIVVVTHDEKIAKIADRVIQIRDGKIHKSSNNKTYLN
ncbi:ABC transporter ATP-binding protein, partial [Candidatus Peregrinibacteria bacterium]|nr:ABC transporter ATP-binding protein [Candidatus Peregrinibacteria bacterium]